MPTRFRKRSAAATARRRYKKKAYRRRGKMNRTTVVASVGQSPIAPRLITRLKYSQAFSTSLTSGLMHDQSFNLNSVYDPDYTGSGHQPYGFDTLATIYNKYRVFATKYRVDCINNAGQGRVIIITNNTQTSFNSADAGYLMELPRSYTKIWDQTKSISCGGKVNLPKLTGVTPAVYKASDLYAALTTASPSEQLVLHLCWLANGSSTLVYSVTLEYYVEFYDPKDLAQS